MCVNMILQTFYTVLMVSCFLEIIDCISSPLKLEANSKDLQALHNLCIMFVDVKFTIIFRIYCCLVKCPKAA